jgi:hypothetical protein
MRVASAFVLAAAFAGFAGASLRTAAADPAPVPLHLELTAPSACPDASDFRREMERRGAATRSPVPGEKAGVLRVEIVAVEGAAGVVARLAWTDDEGKTSDRRLEAPDCRAAENALALIAALAVVRGHPADNDASPAAPIATGTATPSPPPAPAPSPAPSSPSTPGVPPPAPAPLAPALAPAATATHETGSKAPGPQAPDRRPIASFSATADAFLSLGSAPQPAFGFLALAGVAIGRDASLGPLLVRAGIAAIPTQSNSVAGAPASFGTLSALGEVCPLSLHLVSRVLVSPCGLGEFGAMYASGPSGNTLSRPWAAAGVEARASIQLVGSLFFDASIDGLAALGRNRFHVSDTLVYETPPAVGRFSLGLGWLIP